jgi:phosphoribosylglycinamide formyltransferase-1
MEALVAAMAAPDYPATPVLLLTNRPDAGGLHGAAAQTVAALCIDHRPFRGDRAAHEAAMLVALHEVGAEIVCLAGYMRILTPLLVGSFAGRMLNIHPSLLPLYPGLHTHERAIAAGDARHGCTVHVVTEVMDEGPVVAQAEVPILAGDDPDTLAARVLVQEHLLYPRALAAFIEGLPL